MKNSNFKYTCIERAVGKNIYRIENYKGMTEDEILDACAGGWWYFGGFVLGNIATLYID